MPGQNPPHDRWIEAKRSLGLERRLALLRTFSSAWGRLGTGGGGGSLSRRCPHAAALYASRSRRSHAIGLAHEEIGEEQHSAASLESVHSTLRCSAGCERRRTRR